MEERKTDRFPFTLSEEEARWLVGIAPEEWTGILGRTFGNLFMQGKYIEVSKISYEEMRNSFNKEQNLVLDEIFGKDEEFIPDGTPCLVSYNPKAGWDLRYATGKGEFY